MIRIVPVWHEQCLSPRVTGTADNCTAGALAEETGEETALRGVRVAAIAPLRHWDTALDLVDMLTAASPRRLTTNLACHWAAHIPYSSLASVITTRASQLGVPITEDTPWGIVHAIDTLTQSGPKNHRAIRKQATVYHSSAPTLLWFSRRPHHLLRGWI